MSGVVMSDVVRKLTAEQALRVLARLCDKGGQVREAVLAEARRMLTEVDMDEIADSVYFALDSIDVHDCWDRAGSSRDGYTAPEEAAVELLAQELRPFIDQVDRYHALAMHEQEAICCRGVVLGLYRYEHESKSEFRDWCTDVPIECAGDLLDQWRARTRERASVVSMDEFIRERCANWAGPLLRTRA